MNIACFNRRKLEAILDENGVVLKGVKSSFKAEVSEKPKAGLQLDEVELSDVLLIEQSRDRLDRLTSTPVSKLRPDSTGPADELVHEICSLWQYSFNPSNAFEHEFPSFNVWIGFVDDDCTKAASLVLMDRFIGEDGKPIDMWARTSGFSALAAIAAYAREQASKTSLVEFLPTEQHPFHKEVVEQKSPSAAVEAVDDDDWKDLMMTFRDSPDKTLRRMGGLRSRSKVLDVLYRVQEYGYDGGRTEYEFLVFGYIVWAVSAGAMLDAQHIPQKKP